MPQAYGIGGFVNVPAGPISGNGAPAASFIGGLGQQYFDTSTSPPTQYIYNGSTWQIGGNGLASTTVAGVVTLTDNNEPVATKVYVDAQIAAVVVGAVPPATEATAGIAKLSTAAMATAGTDDTTIMTPLKVADALAGASLPFSGTTGVFSGAVTIGGLLTANASATIKTAGTTLNLASDNDAGEVNLAVGTTARTVGIANSAAAHLVTIGSTTGAASLTLQAGTG